MQSPDRPVEDVLREVLARPEFQWADEDAKRSAWQQLRDWVSDQLEALLEFLGAGAGASDGLRSVWQAGCAALALWIGILWIRRLAAGASPSPLRDAASQATKQAQAPTSAAALAAARASAEAGRLAEAMHELYRAVLLSFAERKLVAWDPARTSGDVARALPPGGDRRSFRALVAAFEPIAFGGRHPNDGAWQRMNAAARELGVEA